MKKFVKKILLSLVITLSIYLILDYVISLYLQNSHWRVFDTWTKIVNSEFQDNDLLIFGSSRAWVQYSPAILDSILCVNSYNLGIDGSWFDRQYVRWLIYNIYCNKKPKYIIINTDYVSTLGKTNEYEKVQFYPFFWNYRFRNVLFNSTENISLYEKYMPMYRYFKYGFYNIYLNKECSLTFKGYEGQRREWDSEKLNTMDSVNFTYNKEVHILFENFIRSTMSDSLKIMLVMSPMYEGVKKKATQLDLMYSTYNEIAHKYNVPLLDYTFCEISKDTANFYNAMHLNKRGAELFSTQLANDLTKIIK